MDPGNNRCGHTNVSIEFYIFSTEISVELFKREQFQIIKSRKTMKYFQFEKRLNASSMNMKNSSDKKQSKIVAKIDHLRNRNFLYGFRPIHILSRVIGLMPFSIIQSYGSVQKPRVSVLDGLWFVISLCSWSFFVVQINIPTDSNNVSYVLVLSSALLAFSMLIYCMSLPLIDMCNRYKIVDIIIKFTIFDQRVSYVWMDLRLKKY